MDPDLAAQYLPLARRLAAFAVRRYRQEYAEAYADALNGLATADARCRSRKTFPAFAAASMRGSVLRGIRTRTRAARRNQGVSLDWSGDGTPSPYDTLVDSSLSPHVMVERAELWRAVDRLPPRTALAVRLHYQWGLSQRRIAPLVGVSQMQVSRILAKAYRDLAKVV